MQNLDVITFFFYQYVQLLFIYVTSIYVFTTLTTGKNEKEYSWHVPAIKCIGMKQLV